MRTTISIKKVIANLKKIQSSNERMIYWFFRYSLNWIKNRANTLLNQRTNGYNSSKAREWTITYNKDYAKLENNDLNSGAIEFGIGYVGENYNQHIASHQNGWDYNIPTQYKDQKGFWSFQLPNGTWITTRGYVGKSFLFDAFMEYKQTNKYSEFYQKAFDKVMKGIGKKI